jgi:two-component system, NarL family, response regulator NreC
MEKETRMKTTTQYNATACHVLVAGHDDQLRQRLSSLTGPDSIWQVCDETVSEQQVAQTAKETRPNVVVTETVFPDKGELETINRLHDELPECQVLIVAESVSRESVLQLLQAGAIGCVLKSDADQVLLKAMRSVRQEHPYFSIPVSDTVLYGHFDGYPEEVAA